MFEKIEIQIEMSWIIFALLGALNEASHTQNILLAAQQLQVARICRKTIRKKRRLSQMGGYRLQGSSIPAQTNINCPLNNTH